MYLATQFITNLHKLSVSQIVIYLLLILTSISNIRAAFLKITNPAWSAFYKFAAAISTVYLIYAILLLIGVLAPKDYVFVIRWVTVLLVTCLWWPSALHIWEEKAVRAKLDSVREDHNLE